MKTNKITHAINKIKTLIIKHTDVLIDKEIDLINFETKCSNLHGLPKVHKIDMITEVIKNCNFSNFVDIKSPNDLQFRPIVAGPISSTSRLSEVIDILIKPYRKRRNRIQEVISIFCPYYHKGLKNIVTAC